MEAHELFIKLRNSVNGRPGVGVRSMMGNPAVTAGGKIAFMLAGSGRIVFKLGGKSDLPIRLLHRLAPFAPMATRAPMRGWFEYTGSDQQDAALLAKLALEEVV